MLRWKSPYVRHTVEITHDRKQYTHSRKQAGYYTYHISRLLQMLSEEQMPR